MTLPIVIGLVITGYRNLRLFVLILFSGLLSLTLLLTMSRGGWISAFTGLLFMAFLLLFSRQFNKKKLILSIIAGGLCSCVYCFVEHYGDQTTQYFEGRRKKQ